MAVSRTPAAEPLTEEELRAWRGMLEAHATLTHALDTQLRAEHDLPLASYEVLMFLADAEGERLRMSEIADRALVSRSGLTRLVDRLERAGLAERCACDDDGRGAYAQLTTAGRARVAAARRTHLDGVRRLFLGRLSAAQQRALGAAWDAVLR